MELQSPPAKIFTLYGLKRPDDNIIRYIGITCADLGKRLRGHVSSKTNNAHKTRWVKKMHPLIPEIVPYAVCLAKEEACDLEIFVIAEMRKSGANLINVSSGGEAGAAGMKHSDEAKGKISRASLGNKHAFGIIHTTEAKEKIGRASLGNKHAQGNKFFLGRTHTSEAIEKMRRSALERPADVREKFSLARKGQAPWNKGLKKI